jgi:hypothetical protein
MNTSVFRVAVFGDSVMEGQGLLDQDKFSNKAANEIGKLLGRSVDIVVNTARSGAPIEAADSPSEAKIKRSEFVNTYPSLFNSPKLRSDFIENNIQEVAFLLTPELPATFPTISYQVNRMGKLFSESVRNSVELVILDGGANDLDFQSYLNPEDHRDNYIKFYEPRFEEYFHQRTKKLITHARQLFPNAVILYTGLYTPFLPNVSNGDVKELFEHESRKPGWQIWLNNNIIEIKNVDQLVLEAQYRSLHGLTRGLYWMRRTVTEINEDLQLRGPGVIFIHPQFKAENTVFASNSFIHREYDVDKIKDKVSKVRANTCPRNNFREQMNDVIRLFIVQSLREIELTGTQKGHSQQVALNEIEEEAIKVLVKNLDGPTSMLQAFQALLETPNPANRNMAISLLYGDLSRIYNALRASFFHPNENGAQRYTNVIVKRYKERLHRIHFLDDLRKLQTSESSAKQIKVRASMNRFGFQGNLSLRNITQNMLVDSIRLDVTTAPDSVKDFIDELILDMGGGNRWTLTMPVRLFKSGIATIIDHIQPQLIPNTTDIFTIDTGSIHLGSLKQFNIERRANEILNTDFGKSAFGENLGNGDWRPTRITLQINGRVVFDVPFFGNLSRGNKLTFLYPKKS